MPRLGSDKPHGLIPMGLGPAKIPSCARTSCPCWGRTPRPGRRPPRRQCPGSWSRSRRSWGRWRTRPLPRAPLPPLWPLALRLALLALVLALCLLLLLRLDLQAAQTGSANTFGGQHRASRSRAACSFSCACSCRRRKMGQQTHLTLGLALLALVLARRLLHLLRLDLQARQTGSANTFGGQHRAHARAPPAPSRAPAAAGSANGSANTFNGWARASRDCARAPPPPSDAPESAGTANRVSDTPSLTNAPPRTDGSSSRVTPAPSTSFPGQTARPPESHIYVIRLEMLSECVAGDPHTTSSALQRETWARKTLRLSDKRHGLVYVIWNRFLSVLPVRSTWRLYEFALPNAHLLLRVLAGLGQDVDGLLAAHSLVRLHLGLVHLPHRCRAVALQSPHRNRIYTHGMT